MTDDMRPLDIRPYHLVHLVAAVGSGDDQRLNEGRLGEILAAIRANPLLPLRLRCNVDSMFRYQNPGRADDTPGDPDFNDRRDLHVLQRLGLAPGDTRPAVTLLERVLDGIDAASVADMERESSRVPDARVSVAFAKGCELGLHAIVAWRTTEEMQWVKEKSAAAVTGADALQIRPHHLMCMSCFYGRIRLRGEELAPIAPDNLYEAIVAIQRNPEICVTLIPGPCMICTPCGHLHPPTNLCISGHGMALRDQKKDLDLLVKLGLNYGDTLPGRELFEKLYAVIASTTEICGNSTGVETASEWRVCGGPDGCEGYVRACADGLGIPGIRLAQ